MVVDQVNIGRVRTVKLEYDPPIARHRDGPLAFAPTLQWMQLRTRKAHVCRTCGGVQRAKYHEQLGRVVRVDPACVSLGEESLQPLMAKPQNYVKPIT